MRAPVTTGGLAGVALLVALLQASCPNGPDPQNCASVHACADCAAIPACSFCLETNQCLDDLQNCQGDRAQTPEQCEEEGVDPGPP